MALEHVTDQYGTYWRGNDFDITQAQMEENAAYIWNYLGSRGWTLVAVAGILGNARWESGMNPAIWQNLDPVPSNGYGLVQWTPSTKLFDWLDEMGYPHDVMWAQLDRIIYEKDNNLQWRTSAEYPISFPKYWNTMSHSASFCGGAWFTNYERGAHPEVAPIRERTAREWAYYLVTLPDPSPVPTGRGSGKWVIYKRGVGLIYGN
jgi:hypothetical protein